MKNKRVAVDLGLLGPGDISFLFGAEAPWMAIANAATYESSLPEWTYDTLTAKVLGAMNARQLVVWGCPDGEMRYRLTRTRPSAEPSASAISTLDVASELVIATYPEITMAAQFEDVELAEEADYLFHLPPSRYNVEVLRFIDHNPGDQFPSDDDLPDSDHYVIFFDSSTKRSAPHSLVPWTLPLR